MIQSAATAIAKQWARNGIIHTEDREAYQYGVELLLSTLLNVVAMLSISIVIGDTWLFVPYLGSFIPLRLSAGGYHAKNNLCCILLNASIYIVGLTAVLLVPTYLFAPLCIAECCLSLVVSIVFAPVSARNKPLTTSEYKRNRRLSLALESLLLIVCLLLFYCDTLSYTMHRMIFCGQAASTTLIILEKLMGMAEKGNTSKHSNA